jgi:parallel beta-helix repeat protein
MAMRCGVERALLAWAAIVVALAAPAVAGAKDCGGDVACACGDTVRTAAVLADDLVGCTAGLRVKSDATLDCAGHALVAADRTSQEGIVVDGTGITVQGCTVSGFRSGIRVRAGGNNVVSGNDVVGNTHYGIELAVATTGNQIVDNLVADSGDEGIHVGSHADGNVIAGNDIRDSKRENLYLLDVVGCTVHDNRISGAGDAALYVKHSKQNVVVDNEISDRPVQLRGDAQGNLFVGNDLRGAGFIFQAYRDAKLGWKGPVENEVNAGSVTGVKICFHFTGAAHNTVSGVHVDGCRTAVQSKVGGIAPVGNTVDVIRDGST